MQLKVTKLRSGAKLPYRATKGSAGYDLCACPEEPVVIAPGERAGIPTGIAIQMESETCVGLVFARSGLAVKKGISLSNGVGVIDSDYTGEIVVGLINTSKEDFTVQPGDRIAQLAILPVFAPEIIEVESLVPTERGTGGFGSTGVQ